ncbi:MAG: hypothetical protein ACRDRU_23095 [Pseudonocardiaceae bacterium]
MRLSVAWQDLHAPGPAGVARSRSPRRWSSTTVTVPTALGEIRDDHQLGRAR